MGVTRLFQITRNGTHVRPANAIKDQHTLVGLYEANYKSFLRAED